MDAPTLQLLRLTGSPFAESGVTRVDCDQALLHELAANNRMPLLYLNSLERTCMNKHMSNKRAELSKRFKITEGAIRGVCDVLKKANIDYAIFKSIRPYQEVTVDIDILIFGNQYTESLRVMHEAGYLFLGRGPLSTTFRNSKAKINLDIYNEVGVSRIIYLDKNLLMSSITDRELSDGTTVQSLSPYADLLSVITHSIIKEHIYVLSEYYTTLYFLVNMEGGDLRRFMTLANICKVHSVVRVHLGITALLHLRAHDFIPPCLKELLETCGVDELELVRVSKNWFAMPHKYHPATIFRALSEKSAESKARRSFAWQAFNMMSPKVAFSVVKQVLGHIQRQTY